MERIGKRFSASTVLADGRVYFLSDFGEMTVIEPGKDFKVIAKNALGEKTFASPAIYDGQMFIRSEKHLYCIGNKDQLTSTTQK